jgi:guanylate kinase
MSTTDTSANNKQGRIIVFSAPSGAGKTTLLEFLRFSIPGLVYSISATTRSPRPGEQHGEHYFFLSEEEFKRTIEANGFAEWQMVHGNYYGTPRSFLDETIARGGNVVMDIDVFGKKKFDTLYPDAIGILILPPDMAQLEQRLRMRKTESEEAMERRLTNASVEMNFAICEGKYEYRIVNADLERAQQDVLRIVRSIVEQ